jgi:hypothetical protein
VPSLAPPLKGFGSCFLDGVARVISKLAGGASEAARAFPLDGGKGSGAHHSIGRDEGKSSYHIGRQNVKE